MSNSLERNEKQKLGLPISSSPCSRTALLLEPRGDSFAKTYQEAVRELGLPIIIFGSDDVDKTRSELESRGVEFRDDLAKPDWGITNIFDDTFGNFIMLGSHESA